MNLLPVKNRKSRSFYFLCYTLAFTFLSLLVFSPFWLNGKSFIWKPDGLTQHYNSLIYFSNWGRSILKTLLSEHRLSIPLWDFSIGYGSDILTTLHYYVIGDPLNLLAILTPVRYMETLYAVLILLRMYLSGITFSCYCFRMKRGYTAALAGTLVYVFCGYALVLAAMHPYFINPMIYLPLLLLGMEKVLHKEKGHLLIAAAALSAISNFYFFYMLVILTVIYFVIRFGTMKHENWKKELPGSLGRVALFSLTGVAIASVILLPVLLQFLSDMRSDSNLTYSHFYGWDYLERFVDQFLSLSYTTGWTYLGFTAIALLCVFLLFLKRRQFLPLKIGFVLLTAMLLIPAAGSFMNGFSYVANRWSFGYSFLVALIVACLWPELFTLSKKELGGLFLFSSVCLLILLFSRRAGSTGAFFSLSLMLLALVVLLEAPRIEEALPPIINQVHFREKILLALLSVGIVGNSLLFYQINPDGHLDRFVNAGEGFSTLEGTASSMMSVFFGEQTDFFRVAQDPVPVRNDNLNHNLNTIQYYWSLSNGAITQYFNEMALPFHERAFKYSDLNYRAQLQALAGVRYYIRHDPNDYVPYPLTGLNVYEYMDEVYFIDSTEEYLPFGYTSDTYISRGTYDALPYLERQQALLQSVLCDTVPEGFSSAELSFREQQLPYEISHSSDILELDGSYYALKDNAELTFTFDGIDGCETYLLIEGMQASSMTDLDFYTQEPFAAMLKEKWDSLSTYQQRRLKYYDFYNAEISRFPVSCSSDVLDTDFSYYALMTESSYDRSDFLINMGYSEKGQTSITVTLPYMGCYSFENLSVLCLPLNDLSEQIDKLSENRLENLSFGTNAVSGTISLAQPKLLCLLVPYSKGWTAYVDGVNVPLIQANTMNMALPLDAGDHTIELHYQTPGLKPGLALCLLGLGIWLIYFLRASKRRAK